MVDFINTLNGWLWGTPLIVLMFGAGIYFTVASGFFNSGILAGYSKGQYAQYLKRTLR